MALASTEIKEEQQSVSLAQSFKYDAESTDYTHTGVALKAVLADQCLLLLDELALLVGCLQLLAGRAILIAGLQEAGLLVGVLLAQLVLAHRLASLPTDASRPGS